MTTAQKAIALRRAHKDWSLQRIATEIGVTRERVRQALASAGYPTRALRPDEEIGEHKTWSNSATLPLRSDMIGIMTELLVSVDLTRRGYDVYRAICSRSKADLVIFTGKDLLRVEVKAARVRPNGSWHVSPSDPLRRDVVAAVSPDGKIRYTPPLP